MQSALLMKKALKKGQFIARKKIKKISKKVLTNEVKVCIITIVVSDH